MQTTWHKLFSSFCLYQYHPAPPPPLFHSCSLTFFSCNIFDLTSNGLSVCRKCNSNHSRSATAGICPPLSHPDGPDEMRGGGHTDFECLQSSVCESVSVGYSVNHTAQHIVSQRTLMLLVVCCGCGRDKRLTVGFYHAVCVWVGVAKNTHYFDRHADRIFSPVKPTASSLSVFHIVYVSAHFKQGVQPLGKHQPQECVFLAEPFHRLIKIL